jgi:beta-D-galactosyl-(1->4)-L-rhamnose phosphorylase
MTVSPRGLNTFAKQYGYRLTSEDFINGGLYNSTHNAPSRRYIDYMEFIHNFVVEFGRQCVELVHRHGKKAFVFYDDHWVGVEPYGPRFADFGFDGLIKCVFNAFEVRKCSGVPGVKTHELRLHPYLFPTGLKGEPTFQVGGGGNPTLDAKNFWIDARRGIVRAPIDRIGLGGYLSLVEPWPEFQAYIGELVREFRLLKSFHDGDTPYTAPFKVAVLTAWGRLRSWIASGHFHRGLEYNELIESLAGLPVEVEFISLQDVAVDGVPKDVKVIINCGREGSAWSGGYFWRDPSIVEQLTAWVAKGGGFLGIAEPGAVPGPGSYFQLAPVLGVDRDRGERLALSRRKYEPTAKHFITADLDGDPDFGNDIPGIYLLPTPELATARAQTHGVGTNPTEVIACRTGSGPDFVEGSPAIAANRFGKGRSVYFSGFKSTPENTRLLHRAIAWAAANEAGYAPWSSSNVRAECAFFPKKRRLVVINNAGEEQSTTITLGDGRARKRVNLPAHGIRTIPL